MSPAYIPPSGPTTVPGINLLPQGVPPGPARRAAAVSGSVSLPDGTVTLDDAVWSAGSYEPNTLVRHLGIWYLQLDTSSTTAEPPASPWVALGGGYPETLATAWPSISGRFVPLVGAAGVNPALTTQAAASGRADLQLVTPDRTWTFDQLGVQVTTGAAGNAKVLAYDVDADGWPDSLIFESTDLDTTSTGFVFDTASLPVLAAGTRYWVGLITDAAPTLRAVSTAGNRSLGMASPSDTSISYFIRRTGLTYATPPATWTFSAAELSGANSPIVIGRVA